MFETKEATNVDQNQFKILYNIQESYAWFWDSLIQMNIEMCL